MTEQTMAATASPMRVVEGAQTPRRASLGGIEAQLRKALADANAAREPMVAYFIEMAVAEVQRAGRPSEQKPRVRGL